jgi:hypothetical protein
LLTKYERELTKRFRHAMYYKYGGTYLLLLISDGWMDAPIVFFLPPSSLK